MNEDDRLDPNEEKLIKYLEWHAMDGWHFARTWAFLMSGVGLFFELILFFALRNVELPRVCGDCVKGVSLVALVFIILNALAAWNTYSHEKKTQKKRIRNVVRRRFLKGVNDNPNINLPPMREKANVVYVCDKCDRDHTDPPEILELKGATGIYYQVMCPKCWQHTGWYDTPREAEDAWNKKHCWLLEGSWAEED